MSVQKLDFSYVKQSKKGFTTFLNEVVQNISNGFILGVYTYLSTLPPEWNVNRVHLSNHFKVGRDKINSALSWLNDNYLIEYKQNHDEKGKFLNSYIEVQDGLEFIENFNKNQTRSTGTLKTRLTANPFNGKSAPINNINNINKNKKERATEKSLSSVVKKIKKSYCPGTHDLIISDEAKRIAKEKNLDISKLCFSFQAYAQSQGWLRENWKSAFIKWVIDEKTNIHVKTLNEARSTVQWFNDNH